MLVLQFELGEERYAIDSRVVLEVLPLGRLRQWPSAPEGIAGLVDVDGSLVPVFDLATLRLGRPAERRLSTRLLVVTAPVQQKATQVIGLIAERATTTARCDADDFAWLSIDGEPADSLGPVATDEQGLLQLIDMQQLVRTFGRSMPAAIQEAPCPSPTSSSS